MSIEHAGDKDCVRLTAGNVRMSTSISTVFSSNYSVQCSLARGGGGMLWILWDEENICTSVKTSPGQDSNFRS